ncbi:MAG: biotin synthase BioB [Verrucomicrobiales bacterium]|jgi:biotin synthase|nr:biotin synthase BioB [Verrucomicrobiales bacterium]
MAAKTFNQLEEIYHRPIFQLLDQARAVFRANWTDNTIQLCTLLSIKTGGCSEDCAYCAQSSHYHTGVQREELLGLDVILAHARRAADSGATRFCMGAAWKGVREGTPRFEQVKVIISEVAKLGMEVCVTLGELTEKAAEELKAAGVTAYNHNLDTSPEFYPNIVTTHTYADRLRTIRAAQKAGMDVCCGGILGMGETVSDRLRMLEVLTGFDPAPESVPINCLVGIGGTPLAGAEPVGIFDLLRMIATARVALPRTKVRLSAGRSCLTREGQAMCFYAGANSIFYGGKLLTTPGPAEDEDLTLIRELGLTPLEPKKACLNDLHTANPQQRGGRP